MNGYTKLWESKNGKYAIYEGSNIENPRMFGRMMLVDESACRSDYPIRYSDGRIAYNNPWHWPKYVQKKVGQLLPDLCQECNNTGINNGKVCKCHYGRKVVNGIFEAAENETELERLSKLYVRR